MDTYFPPGASPSFPFYIFCLGAFSHVIVVTTKLLREMFKNKNFNVIACLFFISLAIMTYEHVCDHSFERNFTSQMIIDKDNWGIDHSQVDLLKKIT